MPESQIETAMLRFAAASAEARLAAAGANINCYFKQIEQTYRYVWRTQDDDRVRLSHRRNEGRIFSWSAPPSTGHPEEDYNCRCETVTYISGQTEFALHDFVSNFDSPKKRWSNADFVRHYYFGGGRAVTLREIGHLREIAEHYGYGTGKQGAFRRLANQIASKARKAGSGFLTTISMIPINSGVSSFHTETEQYREYSMGLFANMVICSKLPEQVLWNSPTTLPIRLIWE